MDKKSFITLGPGSKWCLNLLDVNRSMEGMRFPLFELGSGILHVLIDFALWHYVQHNDSQHCSNKMALCKTKMLC